MGDTTSFMNKLSLHILRIGLGITFLWIGIMILKDPAGWGGFIKPWARNLLPVSIERMMFNAAILDILVGAVLLVGVFPFTIWLASLLGSFHLLAVLIVSGIDSVTVRDIGLFGGTLFLTLNHWPQSRRGF